MHDCCVQPLLLLAAAAFDSISSLIFSSFFFSASTPCTFSWQTPQPMLNSQSASGPLGACATVSGHSAGPGHCLVACRLRAIVSPAFTLEEGEGEHGGREGKGQAKKRSDKRIRRSRKMEWQWRAEG